MNKSAFTALAGVGVLALAAFRKRQTRSATKVEIARPATLAATDKAAHRFLMAAVIPIWVIAGFLDYILHRRTKIELTSGPRESLLHLMMLSEGAPVVLAPLLLQVNAGVLAMIYAAFLAHEATAMWDVDTSVAQRVIPSDEQHVHAFLEGVPFTVAVLYTVLHWGQFLSLAGAGDERAQFDLRLKEPRITLRDAAFISASVLGFDVLPHVEEYIRCLRAQNQGLTGSETPQCAQELFAEA
jgi:hypothetical protein